MHPTTGLSANAQSGGSAVAACNQVADVTRSEASQNRAAFILPEELLVTTLKSHWGTSVATFVAARI